MGAGGSCKRSGPQRKCTGHAVGMAELSAPVLSAISSLEKDGLLKPGELDARVLESLSRVQEATALLTLQQLRDGCSSQDPPIRKKSAYFFKLLKKAHRDHHDESLGPAPSIFDGSLRREKKTARKRCKRERQEKELGAANSEVAVAAAAPEATGEGAADPDQAPVPVIRRGGGNVPVHLVSTDEERKRQVKAEKAARRRKNAKEKLRASGATPQVQKKRRRDGDTENEDQTQKKHALLRQAALEKSGHKAFVSIKGQS